MNQVYTFRVLIDYSQDVFRDIEVNASCTFLNFHKIIQASFNFNGEEMSSFYMSNENWDKGQEVALCDLGMNVTEDAPTLEMEHTELDDLIKKKGDKMLYVSDFLLMWCFYIELVEIREEEEGVTTQPNCIRSFGDAPGQYDKDISEDLMQDAIVAKEGNDLDDDDIDDISDDIYNEFSSYEDY